MENAIEYSNIWIGSNQDAVFQFFVITDQEAFITQADQFFFIGGGEFQGRSPATPITRVDLELMVLFTWIE